MPNFEPTEEQNAVLEEQGALVAIAKPGSGKTFVLSQLIKRVLPKLADHRGVIAISHTNKACNELKHRSEDGSVDVKGSFFGTIDSFCASEVIIPFAGHLWGASEQPVSVSMIEELPEDEQDLFSGISGNSVNLSEVESHLAHFQSYFSKGMIFLESLGALALYVVENSSACRRYLCARYSHIIVDEYQDSGLEQHEIFLKLHELGLVAVAVGDPDQSIFKFADKDPKYLLSLAKRPDFKTYPITTNHRSHPSIINYATRLLDENSKLLEAGGIWVYHKHCVGNVPEVCLWIESVLPRVIKKCAVGRLRDIAILTCFTRTAIAVDKSLTLKHHYFETHRIENHLSLWSGLFSSLLHYRYNPSLAAQDIIDGFAGGLSGNALRRVKKLIKEVRSIDDATLYDHLLLLANAALPHARSVIAEELLADVLGNNPLKYFKPPEDDEIQVMTLHKAKGLEFDVVFHLDLHEWAFPAKKPGPESDFDNPVYSQWEQDVNLHYVGITRARKACVLCSSTKRTKKGGEVKNGKASDFLLLHNLAELRKEARK